MFGNRIHVNPCKMGVEASSAIIAYKRQSFVVIYMGSSYDDTDSCECDKRESLALSLAPTPYSAGL